MDRRESLKTLIIGGAGTTMLLSCRIDDKPDTVGISENIESDFDYGRTPEEERWDENLMSEQFYTENELATMAILADIIIPGQGDYPPASKTGITDFIEFISKDIPEHQTPMRGGLRWLRTESHKRFDKDFTEISSEEQLKIVEDIAYPMDVKPQFSQAAIFFSRLRNLVTTGYFTSKPGIEFLGYMGNKPNVWDGVPQDVLDEHGLAYDEKMLKVAIKPEERNEIEDWNDYIV
ncbi:gluconate 2-dehydrogenase subunit 3 family protein [Gramella sp. AN32]|uniref:Gluconate 2-dehydrogenase subunit 3 family protein n=1 Tax=Christiangramia antarctica TaxID=2058158 RepID=A0ABW5X1A9_9FLAO|nr:gluconate 2-dehydrogenase subunit 3 family protein [Gramella sp. AN32]MCM4155689.1 hypothetical protein [Gramella sp. AN32]